MDKKRMTAGIIIAAAAVCFLIYNLRKGPSSDVPESGGGQNEAAEDVEIVDADGPFIIVPEEAEEEAAADGESVTDSEPVKEPAEKEETAGAEAADKDEKKQEEQNSGDKDSDKNDQGKEASAGEAFTEYDAFMAKSPSEQDAFMKSFGSTEAFTEWLVKAQKEWAEAHPAEEIGSDGVINLGQ